jgi:primosomal protein N' (replication factor Y)
MHADPPAGEAGDPDETPSATAPPAGTTYPVVVPDTQARGLSRAFTYRAPDDLAALLQIGSRVLVPLGRRSVPGYVVEFASQKPAFELKPVKALLADEPLFNENLLALCRWTAEYYLSPLADLIRCAVPRGLDQKTRRTLRIARPEAAEEELTALRARAPIQAEALQAIVDAGGEADYWQVRRALHGKDASGAVAALVRKGIVEESRELRPAATRPKYERQVRLTVPPEEADALVAELRGRAPKQAAVVEAVRQSGGSILGSALVGQVPSPASAVGALARKGILAVEAVESRRAPDTESWEAPTEAPLTLTQEQQEACALIRSALDAPPATVLVYGITGSGKTEVYLRAIADTLARGKQALMLVPEISLTPQTIGRLHARFGDDLAVLHSALGRGERYDEWRRVKDGRARIAVGARSAVFAPFARLGLIVIDEEHEPAYKQESAPRYHARDVAGKRAELEGAVLLLGSATPSLEAYSRVERGDILSARLPNRIDARPLPPVEIVDMREETRQGNETPFSQRLSEALRERLERGEQAILFLNRRGFSTFVLCRECGFALRCPNCDVSLTFHFRSRTVRCHHCDHHRAPPDVCPNCEGTNIGYRGSGTERVEDQVARLFEGARPVRMDRDVTKRKGSYQSILHKFATKEANILIGTQMIAKGLDFPGVTLVGVINADVGLHRPDFRAAERTFQLLTQVAGRAGRGDRPGLVLVQTFNPDHYAVRAAKDHDYEGFYLRESVHRRELDYPPFGRLISFLTSDEAERQAEKTAMALAEELRGAVRAKGGGEVVLGHAPAPLARLQHRFRFYVYLKGRSVTGMRALAESALVQLSAADRRRITVDVDPLSVM